MYLPTKSEIKDVGVKTIKLTISAYKIKFYNIIYVEQFYIGDYEGVMFTK